MGTVYPSVIHSAVSSPKTSTGALSTGLYTSPDNSNSNTRNSNNDDIKPNALPSGSSNLFQKKIPDQILSPKHDPKVKRGIPLTSPKVQQKQVLGKRSFSNTSNNRLLNRNRFQRHSRLNNYLNQNS